MTIAIPIISALAGAVAAGILGQYLRRSKPALIIDELSRSADITPHSTGAAMNPDLVNACKESEFISPQTFPTTEERISEKDYIAAIHSALNQAEISIEGLPAVTEVARALSDCLQRKDYEKFRYIFSREYVRLWPTLIGGHLRGSFEYEALGPVPLCDGPVSTSSPSEDTATSVLGVPSLAAFADVRAEVSSETRSIEFEHSAWGQKIVEDGDGDFFIPLAGPINLMFLWRQNIGPAQLLRARAFAMRTAVSFAADYESDLRDIANFLLTVEQDNAALLESLQRRLRDELLEYERLIIKGFVTNRGGSPVTVTNAGRLFVGLSGYSFTDEERTLRSLGGDQQIDMLIGADREDSDPAFGSSITVEAGGVARFVAASKRRIQDLPDPEVLVKALTGGERKCYLGTMVVSQGNRILGQTRSRSQFSATYTAPQPFRDSASEIQVPPQHGAFTGNASRKTT